MAGGEPLLDLAGEQALDVGPGDDGRAVDVDGDGGRRREILGRRPQGQGTRLDVALEFVARVVRGRFLSMREEDFVMAARLAGTKELWSNDNYVLVMMSVWILLNPIIMVCALALAMSICSREESATQFAIYMSVSNLGATAGSFFYGAVADVTSWQQNYALKGFTVFLLLLAILMYRSHGHPEQLLEERRD
mgnify:CR=1 FL=1